MNQKDFELLKGLFVVTDSEHKTFTIATSYTPSLTIEQIQDNLSDDGKKYIQCNNMPEGTPIVYLSKEGFKELKNKLKELMPDYFTE